jgi:hypothetical protein
MLANNLANASTPGFKVDREFYSLYVSPDALDPFSYNDYPATLPLIDRPWTDFRPGTIEVTGNPFDLAITGRGFFAVEGPAGPIYTRNGSFRLSPDGVLVTQTGYPVRRVGGGRIQATGGAPLEVRPDGTVSSERRGAGADRDRGLWQPGGSAQTAGGLLCGAAGGGPVASRGPGGAGAARKLQRERGRGRGPVGVRAAPVRNVAKGDHSGRRNEPKSSGRGSPRRRLRPQARQGGSA